MSDIATRIIAEKARAGIKQLMKECSALAADAKAIHPKHGAMYALNRAWSEMSQALREMDKVQPQEAI